MPTQGAKYASACPPGYHPGHGEAMMGEGQPSGSEEDRLIAHYFRPLARHSGALALTDDAAVIDPPVGCDVVLKADGIIAGVHFFPDDPPDTVGMKALRVNLSDLAAKAASPLGFLLTLALRPLHAGSARTRIFLTARCSAATRIAPLARSPSRLRCSARCRTAGCCAAPVPGPVIAWS